MFMASSMVTRFMGVAPQILKRELLTWLNMDPNIKPMCAQIGMLNRLDLKGINERKEKKRKPLKATFKYFLPRHPKINGL
jgi:hypothetical protein